MDGEHLFSAAIILVMVNIAFPPNPQDHAAMKSALDIMSSVAAKGNAHMKSLYRLLVNLSAPSDIDAPEQECEDSSGLVPPPPGYTSQPVPFTPDFPQNGLINDGYLDLNRGAFQPVDAEATMWAEGYGCYDVNMDFDLDTVDPLGMLGMIGSM